MLRYPHALGCMHGGEGHSAMRSLLLRETVINESRNCSFMVRKEEEGGKKSCGFILTMDLPCFESSFGESGR